MNTSTKQFVISPYRGTFTLPRTKVVEGLKAIPGVEVIGDAGPAIIIQADEEGVKQVEEIFGLTHRIEEELRHRHT